MKRKPIFWSLRVKTKRNRDGETEIEPKRCRERVIIIIVIIIAVILIIRAAFLIITLYIFFVVVEIFHSTVAVYKINNRISKRLLCNYRRGHFVPLGIYLIWLLSYYFVFSFNCYRLENVSPPPHFRSFHTAPGRLNPPNGNIFGSVAQLMNGLSGHLTELISLKCQLMIRRACMHPSRRFISFSFFLSFFLSIFFFFNGCNFRRREFIKQRRLWECVGFWVAALASTLERSALCLR